MEVEMLLEALSAFRLHDLPDDWTEWVWDREFMDVNDNVAPDEYAIYIEDSEIANSMKKASKCIKKWLSSEKSGQSWQVLMSYNVNTKKLLPALCYMITNGLIHPTEEYWRHICIEAANLYFNLLIVPSSHIYNVFHQNLFSKALSVFKLGTRLNVGKKKKSHKDNRKLSSQTQDDIIFENVEGVNPLTGHERTVLIDSLNSVLHNLHILTKNFSFKSQTDSMEHIIQRLVDLTRLEVHTTTFRFGRTFGYESAQATVFSLAFNAYTLIGSLCQPFHGNVTENVKLVTQFFLPSIMLLPTGGSEPTPRDLDVIKEHTVYFLQYLMLVLKDAAAKGISILIQNLCTKIQDRAELRHKGSQTVVDLMRSLPTNSYSKLVFWFFKLAYHDKACHRLFALEVIAKLLYEVDRNNESREVRESEEPRSNQEEHDRQDQEGDADRGECLVRSNLQRDVPSHRFLLAVIIGRCCDLSGTVRIKALQTLAECTKTNNHGIQELMEEIFVTPYANVHYIDESDVVENEIICYKRFIKLLKNAGENSTHVDPLPGAKAVFKMLDDRIQDDKVFVRKAALQVIENLMRFNSKCMMTNVLRIMFDYCRDPAVLIRKHMIDSLTELVIKYPHHEQLPSLWVDHVLPRIVDPESNVQEKVLECLDKLLVSNIVTFSRMSNDFHKLPWVMLVLIMRNDKRTYLYNACFSWCKSNVINEKTVQVIKTHIGTENNVSAWVLLTAMAEYMDFENYSFILEYYQHQLPHCGTNQIFLSGLVLETLKSIWMSVAESDRETLYIDMIQQLKSFQVHVQLIRPTIDLILATPPFPLNKTLLMSCWAPPLVQTCDGIWRDKMALLCSDNVAEGDIDGFLRVIMTYGDVIQLCRSRMKPDMFVLIKRLWTELPNNPEMAEVGFRSGLIAVMGKLCISSDEFAKDAVPFLGILLQQQCLSGVKINIISIFHDMCIRCTSMVEPVLTDVCLALKDKDSMVREKTLVTLIQLLQEDYLKIRVDLFFYMLGMLNDPISNIQNMTSYYMTSCLLKKHPSFMYSHFIQSLFHYNNYQGHKDFSSTAISKRESEVFCLNKNERHLVYRFMLTHMNDDQRFSLTHKLCTGILNGICEGTITLQGPGESLVQDTFYVLSSDEIRLTSLRSHVDDEPPVNEAEMACVILASNKKRIISQVVKTNVIANIVPMITTLKHKLEKEKSSLIRDLMVYLRDLMRDYKAEIKEIFNEDKQLAAEILYDLKTLEDQEKAQRVINEQKRRDTRFTSESSELEPYDSGPTTPIASPGRPVVPAEVMPVMNQLTPAVRRSVEPLLAKVCEQVKFIAQASKTIQLKEPDGSPVNLNKFNHLKLVIDRVDLSKFPADVPNNLLTTVTTPRAGNMKTHKASTPNVSSSPNLTNEFSDISCIPTVEDK